MKVVEKRMGLRIPQGPCLVYRGDSRLQVNMDPIRMLEVTFTRLLTFRTEPTAEHWDWPAGQKHRKEGMVARNHPFPYSCHNGHTNGYTMPGCANGLDHDRFGTPAENCDQQRCCDSDRRSCPAHGTPVMHCVCVHQPLGWPKPCLKQVLARPPNCPHQPKCL